MKTFEQFFPDLMPLVPGCAEALAERQLLRAAQVFCTITRAWQVDLDPIGLSAGTERYDIGFPDRSELVRMESAKIDGTDWRLWVEGECPRSRYVDVRDMKTALVHPAPTATQSLVLKASLKPSNRAIGVEDFIFDQHVELIAQGAAAKLQQQPQKPYSDANGINLWADFEYRCHVVKNRLWAGNSTTRQRAKASWM